LLITALTASMLFI